MSLIDNMIKNRIGRRLKKRSRLMTKLNDQQKEYKSMSDTLKNTGVHMDFINKYFGEKIANTKSRINRVEKLIASDVLAYEKRNPGEYFTPDVICDDNNGLNK